MVKLKRRKLTFNREKSSWETQNGVYSATICHDEFNELYSVPKSAKKLYMHVAKKPRKGYDKIETLLGDIEKFNGEQLQKPITISLSLEWFLTGYIFNTGTFYVKFEYE